MDRTSELSLIFSNSNIATSNIPTKYRSIDHANPLCSPLTCLCSSTPRDENSKIPKPPLSSGNWMDSPNLNRKTESQLTTQERLSNLWPHIVHGNFTSLANSPQKVVLSKFLPIRAMDLEVKEKHDYIKAISNSKSDNRKEVTVGVKLPDGEPWLELPEGWIALFHQSGGVVYLHKHSRVVTWSRPYCIGTASVKKHHIPSLAIPCYHQTQFSAQTVHDDDVKCPVAKKQFFSKDLSEISTNDDSLPEVNDELNSNLISSDQLKMYLSKIFEFNICNKDTIPYKKVDTNKVECSVKRIDKIDALLNAKLKTAETTNDNTGSLDVSITDRNPVSVLNEYTQNVLKFRPTFTKKESQESSLPHVVEIVVNGVVYGQGAGVSNKEAKRKASEHALSVLAPNKFKFISNDPYITQDHLEIFDEISIDDQEIFELSQHLRLPTPAHILVTCCERNKSFNLTMPEFKLTDIDATVNHSFEMTCGELSVTGNCKNKKIGRQLGSQLLLKEIHPHLRHWGSMLRLYGTKADSTAHGNSIDQKPIQSDDSSTSKLFKDARNHELLLTLKNEMLKLSKDLAQPTS